MLINESYDGWKVYFPKGKNNYKDIAVDIINKNYVIENIFKNTERNYVALIQLSGKKYILKEFKSEIVIPQRRFQTIFKGGEALNTLRNGIIVIEKGLNELVQPLVALIRRGVFIEQSFLVMEYVEGEKLKTVDDIEQVLNITKKIHLLGRYHGDLNTSNFIKTKKGIKILDTQMKEEKILWFNRARDLLILREDLLVIELKVDVEKLYPKMSKSYCYKIGMFFRKIKKLKLFEWIRKKKKILRKKGWKI